jgi:hypothetical protein
MPFLNREIADALCTVITLGFALQGEANGHPVQFDYEDDPDNERNLNEHYNLRDLWEAEFGVTINSGIR